MLSKQHLYRHSLMASQRRNIFMQSFLTLILLSSLCTSVQAQPKAQDVAIEKARWTHEVDIIARNTEAIAKLPHGLARAMSWRESKHIPRGPRSERVEFRYFNLGEKDHKRIHDSAVKWCARNMCRKPWFMDSIAFLYFERSQRATSFCRFQFMGQTLRDLGYDSLFVASIGEVDAFRYWAKYVNIEAKRYGGNFRHAYAAYNGGGNKIKNFRKTGRYGNDNYVNEIDRNQKYWSY